MFALLFPYSGLWRGISGIIKFAVAHHYLFGGNDLKMAARAGALCMVVRAPGWTAAMAHKLIAGIEIHRKDSEPASADYWHTIRNNTKRNLKEVHELEQIDDTNEVDRKAGLRMKNAKWQYGQSEAVLDLKYRTIHGYSDNLPDGYAFALLPENAIVVASPNNSTADDVAVSNKTNIASSYGVLRVLVAIAQVIFATDTLYRTRGDQIVRYGYAAFGFTVIPYIVMSLVYLFGNLVTPDYPTMFMVRSEEMDEVIQDQNGARFDGIVGSVIQDDTSPRSTRVGVFGQDSTGVATIRVGQLPEDTVTRKSLLMSRSPATSTPISDVGVEELWKLDYGANEPEVVVKVPSRTPLKLSSERRSKTWMMIFFPFFVLGLIAIPFAVIGGLTSFHPGQSTHAERVWIMIWLVFGIFFALTMNLRYGDTEEEDTLRLFLAPVSSCIRGYNWTLVIGALVYGAPAIGGFVVVGKMLQSYGNCIRIG